MYGNVLFQLLCGESFICSVKTVLQYLDTRMKLPDTELDQDQYYFDSSCPGSQEEVLHLTYCLVLFKLEMAGIEPRVFQMPSRGSSAEPQHSQSIDSFSPVFSFNICKRASTKAFIFIYPFRYLYCSHNGGPKWLTSSLYPLLYLHSSPVRSVRLRERMTG